MDQRTYRVLEYDKIMDMLAECTISVLGHELVKELKPSQDKDIIGEWLAETSEAETVITKCGAVPMGEFPDIRSSLRRVGIGANLSASELLEIGHVLKTCRRLKNEFKEKGYLYEAQLTIIPDLVFQLKSHDTLLNEIFRCIEPDGYISDNASHELNSIRRNIQNAHERIKERLNSIIHSSHYQKYLQEPIVTIRNDRYVIPVKQEHRPSVPGLIHDQSASGATLFIEPMPVVEANNELKEWTLKEKKEIERILAELTKGVWGVQEDIAHSLDILAKLDFIFAKGRLSKSMRGVNPKLVEDRKLSIINGRHPLIKDHEVVPISLRLGFDFNTLVITGPNTGGKTVTLKTVGLFVLMTQSGLHLPADPGTEIGVFNEVFADIGDEQSIEQSLSTFSSHMLNIVSMINHAKDSSLILLDELGAGTDPTEGAALGMAILDFLHTLGARTVATTHYSELKVFALTRDGMENAAMEFDIETLRPTFRLLVGIPGKSNAFEISRRLGLKEQLIQDAKKFLSQEDIRFEDLLSDMEYSRIRAREEREQALKHLQDIEKLRKRLQDREAELASSRQQILRKAKEEARMILRQAKDEADDVIKKLQRLSTVTAEKERNRNIEIHRKTLKQKLDELESDLSIVANANQTGNRIPKDLQLGETVFLSTLEQKGQVLALPDANGEVLLQVGIMKVTAKLSDLRRIEEEKEVRHDRLTKKIFLRTDNVGTEIDLRGQNVEEALLNVDKYLDNAFLSGFKEVTLIHGKGTGVLRDGIHKYLGQHPHVNSYRLGKYGEGETGVTVVELK
jgi:DNA mismatch repair protein MutS2